MIVVSESNPGLSSLSSVRSNLSTSGSTSALGSTGDYVYDIFYYRPSTWSEQQAAAGMATVTGLPAEFEDDYELATDSEPEDEADEDSNGEGPKNHLNRPSHLAYR